MVVHRAIGNQTAALRTESVRNRGGQGEKHSRLVLTSRHRADRRPRAGYPCRRIWRDQWSHGYLGPSDLTMFKSSELRSGDPNRRRRSRCEWNTRYCSWYLRCRNAAREPHTRRSAAWDVNDHRIRDHIVWDSNVIGGFHFLLRLRCRRSSRKPVLDLRYQRCAPLGRRLSESDRLLPNEFWRSAHGRSAHRSTASRARLRRWFLLGLVYHPRQRSDRGFQSHWGAGASCPSTWSQRLLPFEHCGSRLREKCYSSASSQREVYAPGKPAGNLLIWDCSDDRHGTDCRRLRSWVAGTRDVGG